MNKAAMNNNAIVAIGENPATLECLDKMQAGISQTAMMLNAMADALRANQQIMNELAREVHMLTKVTPAQVKALNAAINDRAGDVCEAARAQGGERMTANAIRKHIRLTMGVSALRELPRADWSTAMAAIEGWNDFRVIRKIREELRKK